VTRSLGLRIPIHEGQKVELHILPPALQGLSGEFLALGGESEGYVYRFIPSDGSSPRVFKVIHGSSALVRNQNAKSIAADYVQLKEILDASGVPIRVVEARLSSDGILELENVEGASIQQVLGGSPKMSDRIQVDPSAQLEVKQAIRDTLRQLGASISKTCKSCVFKELGETGFEIIWTNPFTGKTLDFYINSRNWIVDARSLEFIVIDPK